VRRKVVAAIAVVWGGAVVVYGLIDGIPGPTSAYDAGRLLGFAAGLAGVFFGGRVLLRGQRVRAAGATVLVLALAAGLIAGCGGGGESKDTAEVVADCERDLAARFASRDVPGTVAGRTAERICREFGAIANEQGDLAAFAAMRRNPQVMHPVCIAGVERELGLTGTSIRALRLREEMDRFGRSYCDRMIEAGFLQLGRAPSQLEIGLVYEEHPKLGEQACFMIGMAEVAGDAPAGVEVSLAKKFWRGYCRAVVAERLMGWDGEPLTRAQTRRINVICARVARELFEVEVKSC
jgi:hypothetical protein